MKGRRSAAAAVPTPRSILHYLGTGRQPVGIVCKAAQASVNASHHPCSSTSADATHFDAICYYHHPGRLAIFYHQAICCGGNFTSHIVLREKRYLAGLTRRTFDLICYTCAVDFYSVLPPMCHTAFVSCAALSRTLSSCCARAALKGWLLSCISTDFYAGRWKKGEGGGEMLPKGANITRRMGIS